MNWLKKLFDPRVRLEDARVERLKRSGATAAEIARQRPEISSQVAAMDADEVKRESMKSVTERICGRPA